MLGVEHDQIRSHREGSTHDRFLNREVPLGGCRTGNIAQQGGLGQLFYLLLSGGANRFDRFFTADALAVATQGIADNRICDGMEELDGRATATRNAGSLGECAAWCFVG